METLGAARVQGALDRHGVKPARGLGQNFVVDPNTVRKMVAIARLAGPERVLEIGAGAGSLTVALAASAAEVMAVELDRKLIPVLEENVATLPNVTIVQGDALRMSLADFGAECLVGNLPYSIATPLVVKVLAEAPGISELTVMTQREVGKRLAATPGSKAYGQVSVVVAFHARAAVAASVSRSAFWPAPRVDSVIVRIERRPELPTVPLADLSAVVRAAFAQRRKTLRNALAPLAGSGTVAARVLAGAGVDPGSRAEEIGLEEFTRVAEALSSPSK
jgi:16S rRNA (adenine1518-N6/adenine1519-N6)-dimethyltransferase